MRFANTGGDFRNTFLQNLIYRELKKFLVVLIGIDLFYQAKNKVYEVAMNSARTFQGSTNLPAEIEFSNRKVPLGPRIGLQDLSIRAALKVSINNSKLEIINNNIKKEV